jgi:hypothetical protein
MTTKQNEGGKTARAIFRADPETVKKAKRKARVLRISWSEYLRQLLERDLAKDARWWTR